MKNFLVLDDDKHHRDLVAIIVEEHAQARNIISVATVEDAIRTFRMNPDLHVVISDYQLQDGWGDQFHQSILPELRKRGVKFIAMSGAFSDEARRYFNAHNVPCVNKLELMHALPRTIADA